MALTKVKAGNILLTTPSASSNDVTPATTQYVTTALANLADSAPSTLNTLNELAAALGDDANFSTTVTNSIAAKLPLAGGTITGNLNISGGAADMALTVRNSASGTSASDGLSITVENPTADVAIRQRENANMKFLTNNTERMRIDASGNVGIGVAPTANWHANATALQISPIGAIWNTSNYEDFNIGNNVYTDGTEKYIQNDAACKIRLTDAGLMDFRVAGAGTAGNAISFTTALAIEATGNTFVGKGFAVRGTQVPSYGSGIEMHQSGNDMHIYAYDRDNSAVKDLTLQNPGGNVGIGTSSPSALLHVNSTSAVSNRLAIFESDINNLNEYSSISVGHNVLSANFGLMLVSSDTAYVGVGSSGNAFDPTTGAGLYVNANGNVGIGTANPTSKLHLESGNAHNKLSITSTASGGTGYDAAIDLLGSASNSEVQLNMGINGDADREQIKTYQSAMTFRTNNVERMRIDSSGLVDIGVSYTANAHAPVLRLSGMSTSAYSGGLEFYSGYGPKATAEIHSTASGSQGGEWWLNCRNQNSNAMSRVLAVNNYGRLRLTGCAEANSGALNIMGEVGNSYDAIQFYHNSTTVVGRIRTTASSTSLITSSDYRLKENVDYTWDATTRLKQLKPARFNFIIDDTNTLVDGFLAHEVSSVVPEAITGTKDEVDSDGQPVLQGIDHSKLVPLLVKTIQELEARITTLEG